MKEYKHLLKPGKYVLKENLATSACPAQIPASLVKSRGSRYSLGTVRLSSATRGNHDTVLLSRNGGTILLSCEALFVSRLYRKRVPIDSYIWNRCLVSNYITVPALRPSEIKSGYTEDLVDGIHLSSLPPDKQVEIVNSLLRELSDLSLATGRTLEPSSLKTLNPKTRRILEDVNLLRAPKQCLSHGDLGSNNVIFTAGTHTVIDWEVPLLTTRINWFDALTLLGSSELIISKHLDGCFDTALAREFDFLLDSRIKIFQVIRFREHFKALEAWHL